MTYGTFQSLWTHPKVLVISLEIFSLMSMIYTYGKVLFLWLTLGILHFTHMLLYWLIQSISFTSKIPENSYPSTILRGNVTTTVTFSIRWQIWKQQFSNLVWFLKSCRSSKLLMNRSYEDDNQCGKTGRGGRQCSRQRDDLSSHLPQPTTRLQNTLPKQNSHQSLPDVLSNPTSSSLTPGLALQTPWNASFSSLKPLPQLRSYFKSSAVKPMMTDRRT